MIRTAILTSTLILMVNLLPVNGMADSKEKPGIQLKAFVDRTTVQAGESISVKVWVESKAITSAKVTDVSCATDLLSLKKPHPESVSASPVTFTFTANKTKTGKSNILIHVTASDGQTASHQIQGVEVKAQANWLSRIFANPLISLILGGLITLMGTLAKERWQRNRDAEAQRKWITGDLVAQLQTNHRAILDGQEAEFESWWEKLMAEGYYGKIQEWGAKSPALRNTAQALNEIRTSLRDYEDRRTDRRLSVTFQEKLAAKLDDIIQKLGQL